MNNRKYLFLIDTGASVSVIKKDEIPSSMPITQVNTIINGIGGQITSLGQVSLKLISENYDTFSHNFHVFTNLPLQASGILGLDFLSSYKCNIDLANNILVINYNGITSYLPIFDKPDYTNCITIPARCEIIHYVYLANDVNEDCIVCAREIEKDVFLGAAIVKPKNGRIPVKILNLREEEVKLENFVPEVELLNEYQACNFSKLKADVDRAQNLLKLLKLNHLNCEEKQSIEIICSKYSDVFFLPGDKLNTTNVYQQSITLKPNINPVYVKPYRLPQAMKPEIDRQIKQMLKDNIIEEAQSDWNSPVLLVPKKSEGSKKWRLVVDFRKLNEVIVDDKFPLPNITDILDSLAGSVYFSHLDLNQGYYQVSLSPESRKYTAFTTSTGQYQLKRLPMGLKTSCSNFSRVMSIAMSGLTYDKCFLYLDDLIIFGRNLEIHNKNLVSVLERLRKVNLKLNPDKCQFLKKEILYLGHLVSAEGVLPDPAKTRVLQNYPIPKNVDEVKRFVAFCNYYRKFVPSFAEITLPLNKLCRKNQAFIWTEDCQKSFDFLKTSLMTPPILQYPDFSDENEFIIQTDASGMAIGAVLCNKDLRPVAYASRPLNKGELNYPTIQKELTAIVWAVKYYRPYLFGRHFIIMTDHKPLLYLFGMKDPSSRLLKFRLILEEYDFKIMYVKGKDNVVADALSRVCITSDDLKNMNEEIMEVNVLTRAQKKKIEKDSTNEQPVLNKTTDNGTDHPRVVELLRKPCNMVEMILMEGEKIFKLKKDNKIEKESECFAYVPTKMLLCINLNFRAQFSRVEFVTKLEKFCKTIKIEEICVIKNEENEKFIKSLCNELKSLKSWTGPRICILRGVQRISDDNVKKFIMHDFHLLPTSGHAGVRRMTNNIKRQFYWPGLEKDVHDFVTKCAKCQKMKYSKYTKQPMTITTTANAAFQKIYLDLVGPLDRDEEGYSYILTIQCELTKFIEAYPIRNKETVTVARAFVQNFVLRFGIPEIIATDRGTEFISATMIEVCKLLNIEKLTSTSYHHQSIGSLENTHKHLGAFLRIYCTNSYPWSHWIPFWCFSFNNTIHTETKYAPFELVFGRTCNIPSNLCSEIDPLYNPDSYPLDLKYRLQVALKDARENLITTKEKRKLGYDIKCNPINYKKKDLVLVKNESGRKLDSVFEGPYNVVEDMGPNVKIEKNKKIEIVHKDRTKLFKC